MVIFIFLFILLFLAFLVVYTLVRCFHLKLKAVALSCIFLLLPAVFLPLLALVLKKEPANPRLYEYLFLLIGLLLASASITIVFFRKSKIADKIILPLSVLSYIGAAFFYYEITEEMRATHLYRKKISGGIYFNVTITDYYPVTLSNITIEDVLFVNRTISQTNDDEGWGEI